MSRSSQKECITQRIKQVRKLETELNRIWEAKRNVGYIRLPKPIRDGWFKSLKVRDDILRSKRGPIAQEVLNAVVVDVWGRNKKYADRNWSDLFLHNRISFSRPGIKRLDEKEFGQLSPKLKTHFISRQLSRTYAPTYACTLPRHYFVNIYKRAYIDKYKIVPSILDSREQEVLMTLGNPVLRAHTTHFYDNYRYYAYSSKRERRRVKVDLSNRRKNYSLKPCAGEHA